MARSFKKIEGDETTHYIPPRKRRQRPKAKMQPPLTPMIDVTFQLLLFFILTFTFRQAEGQIPSTLPQKSNAVSVDKEIHRPIHIRLRPVRDDRTGAMTGCMYEMSGVNISIRGAEELFQRLEGRKASLGEGATEVPIVICPREDVAWRYVIEAFNAAVHARFKNIGFAS